MGLAAMRVPTIFTAKDKFSSVINTMTKNTRTFASGVSRLNSQINNEMAVMNRAAKYAAIAAGTMLFYKAGEDVIEYEKAIASLGAVTGTQVGSMNKQIESLGKETNRSVIDITKGFELIGSKMSQYLKNPEALREIAKSGILMADASRMTAEDAIGNLTSLLNQFGKGSESANFFVNKLSAGEDIGASTIEETTDILRQFAASARMAGADVSESIALVQSVTKTLGKQGVGRNFRNIMTDLNTGKGMDKNKRAALQMVGIDLKKMIDPATTFVDKMRELTKLAGNKQAMGMFFKKTGMEAGATFVRDFHYFEDYLKFIKENDTATAKAAKNNATFAKGWQDLKNAFTNVVVTGKDVNSGLGATKSLMAWMIPNMRNLVNLVASVAVAFVGWKIIVGIVSLVSGVMSAFTAIMSVHRFVVLWATLTNTGYAASLWAVAAATLAAYWPLLLIAGALGLLVYAFWDTGDAADDMVSKQVAALSKGDAAMINSTGVMSKELKKQQDMLDSHKPQVNAVERSKNMLASFKLTQEKLKIATIQNEKASPANKYTPQGLKYAVQTGSFKFDNPKLNVGSDVNNAGESPKNIAGMQQLDMKSFSEQMKQKVEVVIKDPGNNAESVKVNGKDYGGGIPAKTNSTTGVNN